MRERQQRYVLRHPERCKEIQRRYHTKNRQRRNAESLARSKRRYEEMAEIIISLKQVPCADCGVQYEHFVMEFDHVRGKKKYNISNLRGTFNLDRLEEEVNKCEVVCANCHKRRTYTRGQYWTRPQEVA